MKQLMIYKSEPGEATVFLAEKLAEGKQSQRFNLYENTDYAALIKLVFESDEVISWW